MAATKKRRTLVNKTSWPHAKDSYRVVMFENKAGKPQFRIEHKNSKVIVTSQVYKSKQGRSRTASSLARNAKFSLYQEEK